MGRFFSDEALFNTQGGFERFVGGALGGAQAGQQFRSVKDQLAAQRERLRIAQRAQELDERAQQHQEQVDIARFGLVDVPDSVDVSVPQRPSTDIDVEQRLREFRGAAGAGLGGFDRGPGGILEQTPDVTGAQQINFLPRTGGLQVGPGGGLTAAQQRRGLEDQAKSFAIGEILKGRSHTEPDPKTGLTLAGEIDPSLRHVLGDPDVRAVIEQQQQEAALGPEAAGGFADFLRGAGKTELARALELEPGLLRQVPSAFLGRLDRDEEGALRQTAFVMAQGMWSSNFAFMTPEMRRARGIPENVERLAVEIFGQLDRFRRGESPETTDVGGPGGGLFTPPPRR